MQHARIVTAGPVSEKSKEVIETRFRSLLKDEVEFEFDQDASLIGGFAAFVDGKLYDMSILTKLEEIKNRLSSDPRVLGYTHGEADTQQNETYSEAGGEHIEAYTISIGRHMREHLKDMDIAKVSDYGIVQSCTDGVVQVSGLDHSLYGELLEFESDAFGIALDLSSKGVGAVLFSGANEVYAGSVVRGTGRVLDIGVGNELLGRVIDPLGRPLDGAALNVKNSRPIECPAPGIMDRAPVNQPLETGILAIDSMIPIGKGQRELIIGDRQMGKSSIALSAIINQSSKGIICVYCAIGQKASSIVQFEQTLKAKGAMDNCIIVASTASDSAAMQYITPYAGCSIAEYFMHAGKDVLIVYDDLSKHAISYRTMSLLLKRPPGREAYPGDVFYLHSRLLERAAKLSDKLGGGSMTALPIVETMSGDISAYIPTNVISITDGQIYLENELFHAGIRPAVNVGLSVSRVGRAAQADAMKSVSGKLRLQLAQYREMAIFAQFDSDIDPSTQKLLDQGGRLTELLKQDQNTILSLSEQVAVLVAFSEGLFNDMPINTINGIESGLLLYLWKNNKILMNTIDRVGKLSDDNRAVLIDAIGRYRDIFSDSEEAEGGESSGG